MKTLTCQHHSHLKALLKPAVLTAIPLSLVYFTLTVSDTGINSFVLDSPLEKTLTPERKKKQKQRNKRILIIT